MLGISTKREPKVNLKFIKDTYRVTSNRTLSLALRFLKNYGNNS